MKILDYKGNNFVAKGGYFVRLFNPNLSSTQSDEKRFIKLK
jgi:hypothetical protein